MQRTIETKFYTFSQNNSGGYFIEDDINGICEEVIVEAKNANEAWDRLQKIGDKVSGFYNYCECCGERWSSYMDESDGKPVPCIYDTPVEKVTNGAFRNRCFVHYYDDTIKEFVFKKQ